MIKRRITQQFLALLLSACCLTGSIWTQPVSTYAEQPDTQTTLSQNELYDEPTDCVSTNDLEDVQPVEILLPETEEPEEGDNNGKDVELRFYDSQVSDAALMLKVIIPYDKAVKGAKCSDYLDNVKKLSPIKNGYQIDCWQNVATGTSYSNPNTIYGKTYKTDKNYVAIWKTNPYKYSINYQLNGGSFDSNITYPSYFTVESETITLPSPVRKDYAFSGWFKDAAMTQAITTIAAGTHFDTDAEGNIPDFSLYAKWESAKPNAPTLSSVKNPSTGKVSIQYSSVKKASGYEIMMSTDKKFKKNVNKIDNGKKTAYALTNMPKDKTYYFKVRAYQPDSTGKNCYSSYSKVKSLKIKKGVSEVTAKKNSATLKKVKIKSHTNLYVEAKVNKRVKSSDDSYYLVKVDPVKGTVSKKLASSPKNKTVSFTLPVKEEDGTNLIQGKFAIAVKNGKKYKLISAASFINNPEDAATYTKAFPKAASKKGLQGSLDTNLGVHQTYLNILVNQMIASKGSGTPYKYNGKTYYFYDPYAGFISQANSQGITVTGQIMIQWYTPQTNALILKSGRSGGHAYYALDAQTKSSREELEALFSFMAERWSTENCHLDNWIIGNEVNIHKIWYYAGNISEDKFMQNYADTFRILYYAVKGSSKNSRVYICTDHTWNNRCGDWGAMPFIELFNKKIKAQNKNIQWNLAYHAYPSVLTNANVWNDNADPRFITANSTASDFVTPYNLEVLTDFIKKHYGTKTRIILSEQGFTASTGENVQAAALAYSYYKAEFNDMIDAFLIHDARISQAEDYSFKKPNGQPRPAYAVFMYMNTPSYEKYTQSCLQTMGYSSWKDVTSKFDDKKLKNMPKR